MRSYSVFLRGSVSPYLLLLIFLLNLAVLAYLHAESE